MRISGGSSDVCSSDLIANARAALAAAEARVTALEGSGIGQAREALRLAQLSYRAGKSSLIELLDAQQAYASPQDELIAARRARAEAQATLARQAAAASEVDLEQYTSFSPGTATPCPLARLFFKQA